MEQEHIPGKPMYSVGDRVSFQMTIDGNVETFDGVIEIVDLARGKLTTLENLRMTLWWRIGAKAVPRCLSSTLENRKSRRGELIL